MQEWALVQNGTISGKLKFLSDDNQITQYWGTGNFLCLKFLSKDWSQYTSVKVGFANSSSGLIEIINDPDKNGVWKITRPKGNVFVIEATNGIETLTQEYVLDLSVAKS